MPVYYYMNFILYYIILYYYTIASCVFTIVTQPSFAVAIRNLR